jgi:hypothetical protein
MRAPEDKRAGLKLKRYNIDERAIPLTIPVLLICILVAHGSMRQPIYGRRGGLNPASLGIRKRHHADVCPQD